MAPEGTGNPQQSAEVSDQLALDHFMAVDALGNAAQNGRNGIVSQVNDEQIFADLTVLSNVASNTLGGARLNIMRSIETTESSLNFLASVHQGTPTVTTATHHASAITGATLDLDIAETTVSGKDGSGDALGTATGGGVAGQEASIAISADTAARIQIASVRLAANASDAGRLATDATLSHSQGGHAVGTDGAPHGAPHPAGTSSPSDGPVAAMATASLSTATLSINPGVSLGQLSSCVAAAAIDTVGIVHGSASVTLLTASSASVTDTTATIGATATDATQPAPAPQTVLSSVASVATDPIQAPFIDNVGFGAHHGNGGRSWMDAGERTDLGSHAHDTNHDGMAMHMTAPQVDTTHAQFADSGGHHGASNAHHVVFDHIEKYTH